jgi:hypothetical protein
MGATLMQEHETAASFRCYPVLPTMRRSTLVELAHALDYVFVLSRKGL